MRTKEPSETTRRTPTTKEIKAYLLGALHDATLSHRQSFRYSQKGTRWLMLLRRLFSRLDCRSWIYKEGRHRTVYVLETMASFLDFDCDPLHLKTRAEKTSYIRGFFDAEGGIPRELTARFYIQLVQKDKHKLTKIKQILEELNISTGVIHNPSRAVDPDYWRLYVKTASQRDFAKIIGSWHPKKAVILECRMVI